MPSLDRKPRGGQRPARRNAGTFLARRLRQLREMRGLTRNQLAGLAGLSAQTVGRIEGRGDDTRHSVLVALCRALDVSMIAFDPGWAAAGALELPGLPEADESPPVTSIPDFS